MRLPKKDQNLIAEAYEAIVSEVSVPWLQNKIEASYDNADTGYNKERYSRATTKIGERLMQDTNSIPALVKGKPILFQITGFSGRNFGGSKQTPYEMIALTREDGENVPPQKSILTLTPRDWKSSSPVELKLGNTDLIKFLDRSAANQFLEAYKKLLTANKNNLSVKLEDFDIPKVQDMPILNSKGTYGNNGYMPDDERSSYDKLKAGRTKNFNPKPKPAKGGISSTTIAGESPTASDSGNAQYYSYRQR